MGAKTSAEMIRAIKMVSEGHPVKRAAYKCDVSQGALYMALRKKLEKETIVNQQLTNTDLT